MLQEIINYTNKRNTHEAVIELRAFDACCNYARTSPQCNHSDTNNQKNKTHNSERVSRLSPEPRFTTIERKVQYQVFDMALGASVLMNN